MTQHRSEQLHDPGAELLDRASSAWNRYGRIALIAIGVLAAGGALAFFGMRARARSEDQAANRLADANVLFWQGDYKRSAEVAKLVGEQWPGTPSGRDSHRLAGDDAFWTGDFKTAITEYRAYLERHKNGLLADAVRRSLAYALESDRQYTEAAAAYEALVGVFDRESTAEFMVAAARCAREAGNTQHATELLKRMLSEFGSSGYAPMARIELAEMGVRVR